MDTTVAHIVVFLSDRGQQLLATIRSTPYHGLYTFGFGTQPLQGARGVLSFGLEALDRWYGVNATCDVLR